MQIILILSMAITTQSRTSVLIFFLKSLFEESYLSQAINEFVSENSDTNPAIKFIPAMFILKILSKFIGYSFYSPWKHRSSFSSVWIFEVFVNYIFVTVSSLDESLIILQYFVYSDALVNWDVSAALLTAADNDWII